MIGQLRMAGGAGRSSQMPLRVSYPSVQDLLSDVPFDPAHAFALRADRAGGERWEDPRQVRTLKDEESMDRQPSPPLDDPHPKELRRVLVVNDLEVAPVRRLF